MYTLLDTVYLLFGSLFVYVKMTEICEVSELGGRLVYDWNSVRKVYTQHSWELFSLAHVHRIKAQLGVRLRLSIAADW